MTRGGASWLVLAAFAAGAAAAPVAHADAPGGGPPGAALDVVRALGEAADALAAGEHARALASARPVATSAAAPADRAEAHRLVGLAHFFLGELPEAEAAFLAYLRLDLDGRLDPSQVPPEAVTFFEDVRARHAAELRRQRPRQRRYPLLNLLPPGGQLQNRERGKAVALGVAELSLLAVNVASYVALARACRDDDFTCAWDGTEDPGKARALRAANYLSGVALIGVYLYGVIDGFRGYRRAGRQPAPVVVLAPGGDGLGVAARLSF